MFETLFKHPRVLARHRGGPAANARERFLIHRANEGMAHNTLLRTASELLVIAKHIDVTKGTAIGIHEVEIAAASVDPPSTAARSSSWSKMAAGIVYPNRQQLASFLGSMARAQL